MLSVAVHQDISEYKPKVIGSLTVRSCICIGAAVAVGVFLAIWFGYILEFSQDVVQFIILFAVFPIWALGFWRPRRMSAEEFIPRYIEHLFTTRRLFLKTSAAVFEKELCAQTQHVKLDKRYVKKSRKRGSENAIHEGALDL